MFRVEKAGVFGAGGSTAVWREFGVRSEVDSEARGIRGEEEEVPAELVDLLRYHVAILSVVNPVQYFFDKALSESMLNDWLWEKLVFFSDKRAKNMFDVVMRSIPLHVRQMPVEGFENPWGYICHISGEVIMESVATAIVILAGVAVWGEDVWSPFMGLWEAGYLPIYNGEWWYLVAMDGQSEAQHSVLGGEDENSDCS